MGPGWDFLVAGAGPAGARAAELLAARRASVLLLDPKAPWEKPCGGGLTAAALHHTPQLRELAAESQTIREVLCVAPSGASVVVPLRRSYEVTSRLALSRWGLERAVGAGAHFLGVGVRAAERDGPHWRVTDSQGNLHRGRWLLAADGATSRLRGQLAPRLKPELAPTRVAYPEVGSPAGRAVFAFLPTAQGYVWDFPRPDHHSIGIGVAPGTFKRDALDGALDQFRLSELGESPPVEDRGAVIATAAWESGRFADLGGAHFALLGGAAGLADPATGEGIHYALRSAAIAVGAFREEDGFRGYPGAARRAFRREIRRSLLIRWWLYRPGVADRLIRAARRSRRGALLLMCLADAINEHGSLWWALYRALGSSPPDREAAQGVCDCPDGPAPTSPTDSRSRDELPTLAPRGI